MNYLLNNNSKELCKAILSLTTQEECKKFLRDLLTEAEIKEFANRWKVAQMLSKRESYEKIAKETGMSSTTIARVNKWLTKGMGGYKLVLKKLTGKHSHSSLLKAA